MGANSRFDNRPVKTPSLLTNKHETFARKIERISSSDQQNSFHLKHNCSHRHYIHTLTISSMATRTDMQWGIHVRAEDLIKVFGTVISAEFNLARNPWRIANIEAAFGSALIMDTWRILDDTQCPAWSEQAVIQRFQHSENSIFE